MNIHKKIYLKSYKIPEYCIDRANKIVSRLKKTLNFCHPSLFQYESIFYDHSNNTINFLIDEKSFQFIDQAHNNYNTNNTLINN